MKTCNNCGNEKPLEDFSKDKSTSGGRRNRCRQCMSAIWKQSYAVNKERYKKASREWALKNPEKRKVSIKRAGLKRLYSLSLGQYEAMIKEQDGKCKICLLHMPLPYVDHDHSTGKVRALLCAGCNTGLGGFRDSATNLIRAIGYLQKFSS